MDLARRLRRRRALDDRPGAALVRAGREERLKAEQVERRLDEAVEAALRLAEILEERLGLLRIELGDLLLDLRGDCDDLRALLGGELLDLLHERILVVGRRDLVLRDIRNVERRLQREEVHLLDEREIVL